MSAIIFPTTLFHSSFPHRYLDGDELPDVIIGLGSRRGLLLGLDVGDVGGVRRQRATFRLWPKIDDADIGTGVGIVTDNEAAFGNICFLFLPALLLPVLL